MQIEMADARRAYELGRARVALLRALLATLIVTTVAVTSLGRGALLFATLPFAALAFAEWRGGSLARGAHRGFIAGFVTLVLPTSVLRPCCDATMLATGVCCTMPSMCGVAGIVIGLALALVWPREKRVRDHMLAGAGVVLGALSITVLRCAGLFVGEAVGLGLGLVAGVAASAAARAWLASRSVRT
jgi:hypothetical protein